MARGKAAVHFRRFVVCANALDRIPTSSSLGRRRNRGGRAAIYPSSSGAFIAAAALIGAFLGYKASGSAAARGRSR